jgi:hypothetical protein
VVDIAVRIARVDPIEAVPGQAADTETPPLSNGEALINTVSKLNLTTGII